MAKANDKQIDPSGDELNTERNCARWDRNMQTAKESMTGLYDAKGNWRAMSFDLKPLETFTSCNLPGPEKQGHDDPKARISGGIKRAK